MNHLEKIEEIKNHPDVEILDVYNPVHYFFEYYFSIRGQYKGNYFNVYFTKIKGSKPKIKVSEITGTKEQFIKDFGL